MADGIYSMYGDEAPAIELECLTQKYDQLNLYIDDAHGMSWCGKNGRGSFLDKVKLSDQIVLVTSLAKAFGVTGGVTVVKSKEMQEYLRTCGRSLIFSGPLTPPVLGACVESAKLHLSDSLEPLQVELSKRIDFTNYLMEYYEIPVFFKTDTPICFVGVGTKEVGYNLMKRLFNDGHLVNIAVFPAVSLKNTGIRFTINLHQSEEMLHKMVVSLAHNLEIALVEEGLDKEAIQKMFRLNR
jgi:7-keto-8-aminopelargonate synthetase-like enzyme